MMVKINVIDGSIFYSSNIEVIDDILTMWNDGEESFWDLGNIKSIEVCDSPDQIKLEEEATNLFIYCYPNERVIGINPIDINRRVFVLLSEVGEYQIDLNGKSVIFQQRIYQGR